MFSYALASPVPLCGELLVALVAGFELQRSGTQERACHGRSTREATSDGYRIDIRVGHRNEWHTFGFVGPRLFFPHSENSEGWVTLQHITTNAALVLIFFNLVHGVWNQSTPPLNMRSRAATKSTHKASRSCWTLSFILPDILAPALFPVSLKKLLIRDRRVEHSLLIIDLSRWYPDLELKDLPIYALHGCVNRLRDDADCV